MSNLVEAGNSLLASGFHSVRCRTVGGRGTQLIPSLKVKKTVIKWTNREGERESRRTLLWKLDKERGGTKKKRTSDLLPRGGGKQAKILGLRETCLPFNGRKKWYNLKIRLKQQHTQLRRDKYIAV